MILRNYRNIFLGIDNDIMVLEKGFLFFRDVYGIIQGLCNMFEILKYFSKLKKGD